MQCVSLLQGQHRAEQMGPMLFGTLPEYAVKTALEWRAAVIKPLASPPIAQSRQIRFGGAFISWLISPQYTR
jgi:hypothetical protein